MEPVNMPEIGGAGPGSSTKSPCMDCIFWYQCRRGEIDCHLRPLRSIENAVRA